MRPMAEKMELLATGVAELGLTLSDVQLARFETYFHELTDWNQRMSLTAITDYEEVQVKHFLDSLTLVLAAEPISLAHCRVIDIGTGAGLPGLALKILSPDISLTLADSVGKKTRFLQHLVHTLGLSEVDVHTGRAEDLARRPDLRESFDLVLARGVARLRVLAEYTLPFCKVGGRVVAWKSGSIDAELAQAESAIAALGGQEKKVHPVDITGLKDGRVLVVLYKMRPTPDEFPRRVGIPAKRPL